jgi:hypothetical protein
MTIVILRSEEIELNLLLFRGQIRPDQLEALGRYHAANRDLAASDVLHIIEPGADFSSIGIDRLGVLREQYRMLYAQIDFHLLRRSAWLCLAPEAQEHLRFWLADRHKKDGFSTHVDMFGALADAGDWLMLNEQEMAAVESLTGFDETVRFDSPGETAGAAQAQAPAPA